MAGLTILHNRYFQEIKAMADTLNVSPMDDLEVSFIQEYIKNNKVKSILEVNTVLGYSTINFLLVDNNLEIVTIEENQKHYLQTIKNLKLFFLENRVTLIYKKILTVILNQQFDMIILDGLKDNYSNYFNYFLKYLKKDGSMITTNLSLKLLSETNKSISFLKNNKRVTTEFKEVGDGIAISKWSS